MRPLPRCPVFGRAWPVGLGRGGKLGVPERYSVRSAGPQRRRRRRRWTGSRPRPTCCPRHRLRSAVESPRPRHRVCRRPTRPPLSPPGWPPGLRTVQWVAKAPGAGMRTTREAPRSRAALLARRAGASRWRASGTVMGGSRSVAVLARSGVCPRRCQRSVWRSLTSRTSCRRESCCTCGTWSARSAGAWACMTAIARGTGGTVAKASSEMRLLSRARSSLACSCLPQPSSPAQR